jgi:hypothetical protein
LEIGSQCYQKPSRLTRESARNFVRKLAEKTQTVSSNWLRTYVADCPDQDSRHSAVTIFAAAIRSCINIEDEQIAFRRWRQAWKEQMHVFNENLGKIALPTKLEGSWKVCEDVRNIGTQRSSSVGIIVSYLNVLLEAARGLGDTIQNCLC